MARQDKRIAVHYAPAGTALCVAGRRQGVTLVTSASPRETTCGQCHRLPEWKTAWRNAAKVEQAPLRS